MGLPSQEEPLTCDAFYVSCDIWSKEVRHIGSANHWIFEVTKNLDIICTSA